MHRRPRLPDARPSGNGACHQIPGLVLAGIAAGTVLGLVSGISRLLLLEDSVPTAAFVAVCIGSLWTARPLMYRFAIEFTEADTSKVRDFADK